MKSKRKLWAVLAGKHKARVFFCIEGIGSVPAGWLELHIPGRILDMELEDFYYKLLESGELEKLEKELRLNTGKEDIRH